MVALIDNRLVGRFIKSKIRYRYQLAGNHRDQTVFSRSLVQPSDECVKLLDINFTTTIGPIGIRLRVYRGIIYDASIRDVLFANPSYAPG